MLKEARSYEEEVQRKHIESWDKPDSIYFCTVANSSLPIYDENCCDARSLVSVDENDNVIGYIHYDLDLETKAASNFAIISFNRGDCKFFTDVHKAVCDIFEKYKLNRLTWFCYTENRAKYLYRRYIKEHGGKEYTKPGEADKLQDGKLHDRINFEIMVDEFKK